MTNHLEELSNKMLESKRNISTNFETAISKLAVGKKKLAV